MPPALWIQNTTQTLSPSHPSPHVIKDCSICMQLQQKKASGALADIHDIADTYWCLRTRSGTTTIQGRLYLLHGGANKVVHCIHRLHVQLCRGQAAHKNLKCHCNQWATASYVVYVRTTTCRCRCVPLVLPPIRCNGESWWQQRNVWRILAAHCDVDGWKINGAVHN